MTDPDGQAIVEVQEERERGDDDQPASKAGQRPCETGEQGPPRKTTRTTEAVSRRQTFGIYDAVLAPEQVHADEDQDDADELGDGERSQESVVLGPDDLDKEALDTHQHQERPKDPSPYMRAAAETHEDEEHQQCRRRLVKLGRMHLEYGVRRHAWVDMYTELTQGLGRRRRRAFREGDPHP